MKKYISSLLLVLLGLNSLPLIAEDAKAPLPNPAATEARAKAKVERKKGGIGSAEWDKLSPEQKATQQKERKEKADAQLKELKAKKAAGSLTAQDEKRLERLENRAKRGAGNKKVENTK